MDEKKDVPDRLKDLIDDYFTGIIGEDGVLELEALLRADESSRHYFVRYSRMHTDIHQAVRASKASQAALQSIKSLSEKAESYRPEPQPSKRASRFSKPFRIWAAIAALVVLMAFPATYFSLTGTVRSDPSIAWVMNAQNCIWKQDLLPTADMKAGKKLALDRGLVEIGFECGASVVLEGPASLELTSAKSARLQYGKLTARVPKQARGFSIVSPQGKVIDLGTEFGVSVAENGATQVYVFKGEVKAIAKDEQESNHDAVSITQNHGARIETSRVSLTTGPKETEAKQFVREIPTLHTVVPQVIRLDFEHAVPGSLADSSGTGTGLRYRLPGTGSRLLAHDENLKLDMAQKQLELTTTNSDINRRFLIDQGEYLGFRLSDLGFSGSEDFSIMVTIPKIPSLNQTGQFGLYAGAKNDKCIRGGLISSQNNGSYTLFMANNNGGNDSNAHFVGVQSSGEDMRMTLNRIAGKYSLTVENLTAGSASSVSIKHPDFLDAERDLFVGFFGANTQSEMRRTLYIKEIILTVWSDVEHPSPIAVNQ